MVLASSLLPLSAVELLTCARMFERNRQGRQAERLRTPEEGKAPLRLHYVGAGAALALSDSLAFSGGPGVLRRSILLAARRVLQATALRGAIVER